MEGKEVLSWIRELGFPAAVALYVLIRLEGGLRAINATLVKILVQLALNGRHHSDV